MKNQYIFIGLLAIAVIAVSALLIFGERLGFNLTQENEEPTICTADAKLCPDGSYMGRVPPTCEFAACPVATSSEMVLLEAQIGKSVSGLGVTITPLTIVEDSRCAIDVVCIQAGTVRVRTTLRSGLGTATQVFELNKSVTTEAEIIELVAVLPVRHAGISVEPSDYRFMFQVTKHTFSRGGKG